MDVKKICDKIEDVVCNNVDIDDFNDVITAIITELNKRHCEIGIRIPFTKKCLKCDLYPTGFYCTKCKE